MCGFFGVLNLSGQLNISGFNWQKATELLKHRGPDGEGHFFDSRIYLGHRRLSIIDLASGKQPMFNGDGTKCIVFNGEIFNFQEIRRELEACGHRFSTNSDTESILHAYEEWGNACVEKFRGMFAFAIWDMVERKLFIARDRLGIKPIFYAFYGGVLYFASEMKAILQCPNFPREMDSDGLTAYFALSYIPAPLTIFKHIRKLLPGHTLEVKGEKSEIRKYWDIYFQPDRSRSQSYIIDRFMELLEESIALRMISEVPLGAFLSGGLDSGAVVALMSRFSSTPVRTFCIGFGGNIGGYLDERKYAQEVASKYGTIHMEYEVSPNVSDIVDSIAYSFDEPFADDSTIPSYYVCKIAREHVTVALSGLGGDELFGGYARYLGFKLSTLYNRLPWFLREKVIRQIVETTPERGDGHYTVNHLKRFVRSASLPQDIRYLRFSSMLSNDRRETLFSEPERYFDSFASCQDLMLQHFNAPNATEPLDRVFYFDLKTYLPEDILACTDRISMMHGLEARVPFLDHKLVEFCATIPNEMKVKLWKNKYILKKSLNNILPKSVINHRKQGFVGPMTRWLQNDLNSYVLQVLSEDNLKKHGLFNCRTVKTILDEHFHRAEINEKLIWSLVMFQKWFDIYM